MISALPFYILHSPFSILRSSDFRLCSSQLIDINTSTPHPSTTSHPTTIMPSDSENSGSEISGSEISDSWHKFDDVSLEDIFLSSELTISSSRTVTTFCHCLGTTWASRLRNLKVRQQEQRESKNHMGPTLRNNTPCLPKRHKPRASPMI